jgi:peptidoglycan hydrolase-like protein with peptidoglycan-binding domain
MSKFAIALLATTVISTPVFAATTGTQQQPQANQMQPQGSGKTQMQSNSSQKTQNQQSNPRQTARNATGNQPISSQSLSRREIRQVQQTLDKDGFHPGPTDGRWGPETRSAVRQFQHSKDLRADGQLSRQTVADLGLRPSEFSPKQSGSKRM